MALRLHQKVKVEGSLVSRAFTNDQL